MLFVHHYVWQQVGQVHWEQASEWYSASSQVCPVLLQLGIPNDEVHSLFSEKELVNRAVYLMPSKIPDIEQKGLVGQRRMRQCQRIDLNVMCCFQRSIKCMTMQGMPEGRFTHARFTDNHEFGFIPKNILAGKFL